MKKNKPESLMSDSEQKAIALAILRGQVHKGASSISSEELYDLCDKYFKEVQSIMIGYTLWELVKKGELVITHFNEDEEPVYVLNKDLNLEGKEILIDDTLFQLTFKQ